MSGTHKDTYSPLGKILFKTNHPELGDKPVFSDSTQLARDISGPGDQKKFHSVLVGIRRIVNGAIPLSHSSYQDAVVSAVRKKLKDHSALRGRVLGSLASLSEDDNLKLSHSKSGHLGATQMKTAAAEMLGSLTLPPKLAKAMSIPAVQKLAFNYFTNDAALKEKGIDMQTIDKSTAAALKLALQILQS